jgi:methylphosphotriester-DNA--protein-cysteine methyltransferase
VLTSRTPERVARAQREGARAGLAVLLKELAARTEDTGPDRLVREAARRLAEPHARLHLVARDLKISERQLRRRFTRTVGYGWRTLTRVQRLQRLLAAAQSTPGRGLAGLASAAGYADQAHLSRDVARLTGQTPRQLLASGAHTAGERAGTFKTCGRPEHRLSP